MRLGCCADFALPFVPLTAVARKRAAAAGLGGAWVCDVLPGPGEEKQQDEHAIPSMPITADTCAHCPHVSTQLRTATLNLRKSVLKHILHIC